MNFGQLLVLIVLVWFLGAIWLAMYFGHRIKMSELDQKYIDTEYQLEKMRQPVVKVVK